MKPKDDIWALHRAILQGHPTAPADVARLVLEPLAEETVHGFPRVSRDIAEQAALDALWDYIQRPQQCRATNARGVWAYLHGAAHKKVLHELRGERNRADRESRWAQQALEEAEGEGSVELPEVAATDQQSEATELAGRRTTLLEALETDIDRRLLELRLSGERKTTVFAEVLGITHLSTMDQRRIVKQHKDRIDKVIRRVARHT